MSAVVDLEVSKFTMEAKKAENAIKDLEGKLIALRKQKLENLSNEEIKKVNKEIAQTTIALKEERISLRETNQALRNRNQELAAAAQAQAAFTRQVTTSSQGIQAINSVLYKFQSEISQGADEVSSLKEQLVALQRLKLSGVLNSADQRVLRQQIFETNVRIREQSQALRQQQVEARRAEVASRQLSQAQQQFRSQVGSSNAVALEFNRIIQDAPFGIIGVGNNIQQLTANFAQLRAGSASTGAALKASLLSIVSPANLVLLGVSAITSLWTAYQLGAFKSAEATEDLRTESEKLSDILSDTEKMLNAVDRANLKRQQSYEAEMVSLDLLVLALNDRNKSDGERIKAFQLIQKEYPRIIGNMTAEQALADGIGKAYYTISEAIFERATAIAIEEELVRLQKEKFTLYARETKELQNKLDLERKIAELEKERAKLSGPLSVATPSGSIITEVGKKYNELTTQLVQFQQQLESVINSSKETEKALGDNSGQADQLRESYKNVRLELLNLLEPLKNTTGGVKDANEEQKNFYGSIEITRENVKGLVQDLELYFDILEDAKRELSDTRIINPDISISRGSQEQEFKRNIENAKAIKAIGDETEETASKIQKLYATEALGGNPFSFLIDSIFKFQEVKSSLDDFADGSVEKMNLLREQAVLTGNIFSGLGDTFASVFASGNRELGQFISALGDFIGQLVVFAKIQQQASAAVVAAKQTEATAAGISAAAQTAASKGPAAFYTLAPLIASAVALVGSAFRGLGGARNTGGRSSATSSASLNTVGSAFSGFGATANPFGDLTLRASIRGTDIELLLERTTVKNRA
jgi:hypothetical protein